MVDWVRPIFCSFVLFPCHPSPTVHFGLGSVLWKRRGRGAVATNQQIYRLNCLSSNIDRERRTNIIIHLVFFYSSQAQCMQSNSSPDQINEPTDDDGLLSNGYWPMPAWKLNTSPITSLHCIQIVSFQCGRLLGFFSSLLCIVIFALLHATRRTHTHVSVVHHIA